MKTLNSVFSFLVILILCASLARADVVLELEEVYEKEYLPTHSSGTQTIQEVVFLSDVGARLDRGGTSYLFRTDSQRLWILNRKQRTYAEFETPVRLEEIVAADYAETVAMAAAIFQPLVDVNQTQEEKRIGAWKARRLQLDVSFPSGAARHEIEIWLADDLAIDLEPFKDLLRNYHALNPSARDWYDRTLNFEGVEVMRTTRKWMSSSTHTITRTLVAVREEAPDPSRYVVPSGYEREEFRFEDVFAFGGSSRKRAAPITYEE